MKKHCLILNKGYTTVYFITMFIFTFSLITAILTNQYYRLRTIENLKEINNQLIIESKVINIINCQLLNEDYETNYISKDGIEAYVDYFDTSINVSLTYPKQELIIITLKDNEIYDYSVIL